MESEIENIISLLVTLIAFAGIIGAMIFLHAINKWGESKAQQFTVTADIFFLAISQNLISFY
mgnify:CR=1 FL=1